MLFAAKGERRPDPNFAAVKVRAPAVGGWAGGARSFKTIYVDTSAIEP